MATHGYWENMFKLGAGEACAKGFLDHIEVYDPIVGQIDKLLKSIGADKLAEMTKGSYSQAHLARVVVDEFNLVHRCLDKLGSGFMDDVILEGLNVQVAQKNGESRKYSYVLEEELVRILTRRNHIANTWWWKVEKKSFTSACRKLQTLNKVHES